MPRLGRFTPGKETRTHCIGGWLSPTAGLDGCGKSRPHWDSIPIASRYTDYAIPAPNNNNNNNDKLRYSIVSVECLGLYYIKNQQDATLAVLFISNCKITLHVSDAFCIHHQEY